MKNQTNQFDRQRAAMKKVMDETPDNLRHAGGYRPKPDRFCEAIWWIGFLACLGLLIYGTLSL